MSISDAPKPKKYSYKLQSGGTSFCGEGIVSPNSFDAYIIDVARIVGYHELGGTPYTFSWDWAATDS